MKKTRGRPPKNEAERKDLILQIPVTASQKDQVTRAANAAGQDMASWARAILIETANKKATAKPSVSEKPSKARRNRAIEYSAF